MLALGAASAAAGCAAGAAGIASEPREAATMPDVLPPAAHLGSRRILLACKLGMITSKENGRNLSLVERLSLARDAGFDGVDLTGATAFKPEQVRRAVSESGVFVHNALDGAHWRDRLTSPDPAVRARSRANIAHCLRVSHAAGGNGVLVVAGHGKDGPADVIEDRCAKEIEQLIPLAAALGQRILIENVWNHMHYDHDGGADQTADRYVAFIDRFRSPWVGLYYDIGNHWKYGSPGQWIRQLGPRCVKLDVKGFSRKNNRFTDIGEGDLPWKEVREALADIGFCGWATAEVRGGGRDRLVQIRQQMERVFGLA